MRIVLLILLLLFSLVLPGTVFHFWSWNGVKPDLVMLCVIYYALHHRPLSGALWGLGAGIITDFYLGRHFGMYGLTLTVVALLSSWLSQRLYKDNYPLVIVLVILVTFGGQMLIALLRLGVGAQWTFFEALSLVMGIALYNALLVPVTYPWVHRSFAHGWLKYRAKYD